MNVIQERDTTSIRQTVTFNASPHDVYEMIMDSKNTNRSRGKRRASAERWGARSRRGESIFPGLIWCSNQIGKLSRPGEPATGGPITTQSPHSICAKWIVERNCASLKLACRLTDSTAIPVDGSKPIGNQCRNSSTRVLLATKREQQMRLPDNELTKENSEQAPSLSVACLATSNVRCLHTRPVNGCRPNVSSPPN